MRITLWKMQLANFAAMDAKHLIIFDLDGTLIQTFHTEDNSFVRALSKFVPIDPNYSYWGEIEHLTDEGVFSFLFQKYTQRLPSAFDKKCMQDQYLVELMHKYKFAPGYFEEIPGASILLQDLQSDDRYLVAISTGSWLEIAQFKLELAGIDFKPIKIACSDFYPDKFSFTKQLIDELSQENEITQITYVGDSMYDYNTSRALGIGFIGVDFLGKGKLNELSFCPILPDLRFFDI